MTKKMKMTIIGWLLLGPGGYEVTRLALAMSPDPVSVLANNALKKIEYGSCDVDVVIDLLSKKNENR